MGVVNPGGGGGEAWMKVVFGAQTRGMGRNDADEAPQMQMVPQGTAAGSACPRCGGSLRLLPGPALPTRTPTQMVGCPACGFVGLQQVP